MTTTTSKDHLSRERDPMSMSTIEKLFPTCVVKKNLIVEENNSLPNIPPVEIIEISSLIVEPLTTTGAAVNSAMLDRKRKERHESTSQEQETKVIRGNDPELDSKGTIDLTGEESRNHEKFIQSSNVNKEIGVPDIATNSFPSNGKMNPMGFMEIHRNLTSTSELEKHIEPVVSKPPQLGYGHSIRPMPVDFEAEKQRQWERTAAQWNARKIRKFYRPTRQGKSSKSFSEIESTVLHPTQQLTHTNGDHQFENLTISCSVDPPELECSKSLPLPTMLLPAQMSDSSPTTTGEEDGEEEQDENELAFDQNNMENSLAPKLQPSLNFTNLHHHIGSQEPLTCRAAHYPSSSDQAMLSPRNTIMSYVVDPSFPPSPPLHQLPFEPSFSRQMLDVNQDRKNNILTRQLMSLKKQLKMLEEEYELLMGYRPSHADKLNNKEMKKHMVVIAKLKKELKLTQDDPPTLTRGNVNPSALLGVYKTTPGPSIGMNKDKFFYENLKVSVKNVEKTLQEIRRNTNRPDDLTQMTHTELLGEKACMQKELVTLEKKYGRPDSKEEKEIVRTLYDRYRTVKKLTGRNSFTTVKENSLDLAPILEHETLDLKPEMMYTESSKIPTVEVTTSPKSRRHRFGHPVSSSSTSAVDIENEDDIPRNEDYNDMDTKELEIKYKVASDEKRKLRANLRKFESEFQSQTGRLPQKEDKYGSGEIELVYQKYKHIRGVVRLLDVLINKRKSPFFDDLTKVETED